MNSKGFRPQPRYSLRERWAKTSTRRSTISFRFFVNDLNGPLYILDKTTRQFTTYLDFNGRDGRPGMFEEFVFASGYANGLITFQFDPDYRNNGKFYTLHMEDPDVFNESDPRGPS